MTGIRLYDYQEDMKQRILRSFVSCRSVMAQMPTGTGKTVVLAAVVLSFLRVRDGGAVWIVAHRRELVEQVRNTVDRMLAHVAGEEAAVSLKGRVKVLSIQWLSRHLADMTGEQPSLIVIDEAHHALANTYQSLWDVFVGAKFLGLTATPCRLDGSGFTDLFDALVTSFSISKFIGMGRLSLFDYVGIKDDSEDAALVESLAKRGVDGDFQVKEMGQVLNNRRAIERLYDSITRYAKGKKGIVYAVNIEHAREIARYYSEMGRKAVAIDSHTPKRERDCLIEDFKVGRTDVLVNVDIFSEGFDCPDVGFIQLARPTLSLARYLQMVGRGLRVTKGKECCVLIDNVGLYRMFGLPTVERDWQAMFEGRQPIQLQTYDVRQFHVVVECLERFIGGNVATDMNMGVIMTHEALRQYLEDEEGAWKEPCAADGYKVFMANNRKIGVRRKGEEVIAPAYHDITLLPQGYAICYRHHYDEKLVSLRTGHVVLPETTYHDIHLIGNRLVDVNTDQAGVRWVVDLENDAVYPYDVWERATLHVKQVGSLSLLKLGQIYYTRTMERYQSVYPITDKDIEWHGFYYTIDDPGAAQALPVCVMKGDSARYYWLVATQEDGTICVKDNQERYYKVGKERRTFITKEEAERLTVASDTPPVDKPRHVEPVRMGNKWGLKVDGRLVVTPIYRKILPAKYGCCVVEGNPCQWGIITLTGHQLVEPTYSKVHINDNGTAELTTVSGKVKTVKLNLN